MIKVGNCSYSCILQDSGGALPLTFCIHLRLGPIYWGEGYLPCKKDYKAMVFYM